MAQNKPCPSCKNVALIESKVFHYPADICQNCWGFAFKGTVFSKVVGGQMNQYVVGCSQKAPRDSDTICLNCRVPMKKVTIVLKNRGTDFVHRCEQCHSIWLNESKLNFLLMKQKATDGQLDEDLYKEYSDDGLGSKLARLLDINPNKKLKVKNTSFGAFMLIILAACLATFVMSGLNKQLSLLASDYMRVGGSTLFTHIFVHKNILQLGLNVYILFLVGRQISLIFGDGVFLQLFVATALVGNAPEIYFYQEKKVLLMGLSGVVSGMLGFFLFKFPSSLLKVNLFNAVKFSLPAFVLMIIWLALHNLGITDTIKSKDQEALIWNFAGQAAAIAVGIAFTFFTKVSYGEATKTSPISRKIKSDPQKSMSSGSRAQAKVVSKKQKTSPWGTGK